MSYLEELQKATANPASYGMDLKAALEACRVESQTYDPALRPSHILADSGTREAFETGMVRDSRDGKGRFELITPVGLRRLALVYERGAAKYEVRNWEKGSPLSRTLDSATRHINDYQMISLYKREGRDLATLPLDINPGEDHLAQAVWNLFAIMHHEELHPEFDDMSKKGTK